MDWAAEVRSLRADKGLTQEEFAPLAGVSRNTIQNWENGRVRRVSNRTRARVRAACLGRDGTESRALEGPPKHRRYSDEAISSLHQALDMILDNARSTVVEKVTEILEHYAGDLSSSLDRRETETAHAGKSRARRPVRD